MLVAERRRRQQRQEAVLTKAVPTEKADGAGRCKAAGGGGGGGRGDGGAAQQLARLGGPQGHTAHTQVTHTRALTMPQAISRRLLASAPPLPPPPREPSRRMRAGGRAGAALAAATRVLALNDPERTVGARAANMGFIAAEKRLEQQFDARELSRRSRRSPRARRDGAGGRRRRSRSGASRPRTVWPARRIARPSSGRRGRGQCARAPLAVLRNPYILSHSSSEPSRKGGRHLHRMARALVACAISSRTFAWTSAAAATSAFRTASAGESSRTRAAASAPVAAHGACWPPRKSTHSSRRRRRRSERAGGGARGGGEGAIDGVRREEVLEVAREAERDGDAGGRRRRVKGAIQHDSRPTRARR